MPDEQSFYSVDCNLVVDRLDVSSFADKSNLSQCRCNLVAKDCLSVVLTAVPCRHGLAASCTSRSRVRCRVRALPNLALWDQGAPATRGPVALAAVPCRPGTPACRSALGRAPGGAPRPTPGRHRRRRARPESRLGDEHQAVTIADMVSLIELGTAINARRRFATGHRMHTPGILHSQPDARPRGVL
jgi:hypothetical protein